MSFGFSVGDFFAVGQLAWSVYKSCKGAGGAFEEVAHEVISLHTVLKEIEDESQNPDSLYNRTGAGKKKELGILVQNCDRVLKELNKLLIKYKSLGTKSKKAWDRLRWGTENLAEIREKIMSHTSSLNLFLTTLGTGSLGRIEKKLDQLIEDVKAGRREETILTMADDDQDEAETQWNSWKSELVDEGFTKLELESHRRWIKAKLKELIEGGGLYEDLLPENENAGKSRLPEKNLESSKNGITSTKHAGLQPTVEDVEDEGEEDNGPRINELNVPQESGAPISESLPTEEEFMDDQEETDQESETSGSTGDTFLPSDSISNVGIHTAEVLPGWETYTSQPQAPTLHRPSKKAPQSRGKAGSSSSFPLHGSTQGPILPEAPSEDLQHENQKAKHKKSKAFNDSTSDLEEHTRARERYKKPPESKDQPAKSGSRSSIRNESPPYYRRNDMQSETEQFAPREAQFSDKEYYYPDRIDRTQSSNYYGEDFPPYHDRFVLPPRDMPDGNRDFQSEYSRGRPAGSRGSPFDASRNMYSEDQYADPRRLTSRDNPRPDYYHGPMPSDTYPSQGAGFLFRTPESIFADFLRGQAGMGDASGTDDVSADFRAGGTTTHSRKPPLQASPPEVTIIERPLPLTLEELFRGTHKKMKIKVKSFDEFTGMEIHQDKILEMDIKPGLKTGSKIKFKGAGFVEAGRAEALHFIVEEKKHPLFTRNGNDIHHTVNINLRESLCGWSRTLDTIDGRQIKVEKAGPTQPGSFDTYPGLGMPFSKEPGKRGDFIITFAVMYPISLTLQQKEMLSEILG